MWSTWWNREISVIVTITANIAVFTVTPNTLIWNSDNADGEQRGCHSAQAGLNPEICALCEFHLYHSLELSNTVHPWSKLISYRVFAPLCAPYHGWWALHQCMRQERIGLDQLAYAVPLGTSLLPFDACLAVVMITSGLGTSHTMWVGLLVAAASLSRKWWA